MGRRLPWNNPRPHVGQAADGANGSALIGRSKSNNSDTGKMVYRNSRGGRLRYNKSGGRSFGNKRRSPNGYGDASSPPPSQTTRLDGLYLEGHWYCNCVPRMRAPFLQVKKNGTNKGKWFYTCDARKCSFFLWSEDAENRAKGVTLTLPPMPEDTAPVNRPAPVVTQVPTPGPASAVKPTTKPWPAAPSPAALPTPATGQNTLKRRTVSDYFATQVKQDTSGTSIDGTTAVPETRALRQQAIETPSRKTKRKRVLFEFDSDEDEDGQANGDRGGGCGGEDDDYGLGDMSSDEEREINEAMERSARKLQDAAPSTPASTRHTSDYAAVSTPPTVTRTLFPDAKRRRPNEYNEGNDDDDAIATPTGADSYRTPFSTSISAASPMTALPSSSPPSKEEEHLDPTDEVLALLDRQRVDEATMRSVRGVLQRFAMKAKGLAKGRDSVRAAVRTKDDRIADLQERVASLENRNRVQREEIADFKASIMDLYSKH